jgi:hypothetical protein
VGRFGGKRPDQPVSPCHTNASFFCPPQGRSIVSLPIVPAAHGPHDAQQNLLALDPGYGLVVVVYRIAGSSRAKKAL